MVQIGPNGQFHLKIRFNCTMFSKPKLAHLKFKLKFQEIIKQMIKKAAIMNYY